MKSLMNSFRINFKALLKYWMTFGFWSGIIVFYKFKFGKIISIKIPSLKFPFNLRRSHADIEVFNQIFVENDYTIDFDVPEVIIDGGANIGLLALLLANRYPKATIICIEPDKENFAILKQNTINYKNIFCENAGLWDKDTKLKVHDKYNKGKWGIIVEEDIEDGAVLSLSLDTLVEKYSIQQIDILKLDIETSEKQLFTDNYMNWLLLTKTIVIELHDRMLPGCFKTFIDAINNVFSDYEYSVSGENTIISNVKIKAR